MRLTKVKSKKHPGSIFLREDQFNTFIFKIYPVPNAGHIANEIVRAMRDVPYLDVVEGGDED